MKETEIVGITFIIFNHAMWQATQEAERRAFTIQLTDSQKEQIAAQVNEGQGISECFITNDPVTNQVK